MKIKSTFFIGLLTMVLCSPSCSGDKKTDVEPDPKPVNPDDDGDDDDDNGENNALPYRFVITARQSSSNIIGPSYILTTSNVADGVLELSDRGWQADQDGGFSDASIWFYPNQKAAYHYVYRQGPADVVSYSLKADGGLQQHDDFFQIENSWGAFGVAQNKMVTITNHKENNITYAAFNVFDPETSVMTTKKVNASEFINNSNSEVFAGIVGVSDYIYTSLRGGSSVAVVRFDQDLNYKIIRDDRIGVSAGIFRSLAFSQMAADEAGNVYVFSSGSTEKPSAALRINAGQETFDQDYYFNILEATEGRPVYKVWHIKGDYFLIQTYTTDKMDQSVPIAQKLGVANMKDRTFKWVEGVPREYLVDRIANTPCVHEGKILISITTNVDYPYIYTIDPETATATQGLKVKAGDVVAIGKLDRP